eukprot:jgi/Tetstr1/434841/TSEL_002556.t1
MLQRRGSRQHYARVSVRGGGGSAVVRVVHISDTHGKDHDIPNGDILVHSGDFTQAGRPEHVTRFNAYLRRLPHTHKVIVCGNHELRLDGLTLQQCHSTVCAGVENCHMLEGTGVTLMGIRFYGSAANNSGGAFTFSTAQRTAKWNAIPPDTDVLITHSPPLLVMDLALVTHGRRRDNSSSAACSLCGRAHHRYRHWGCQPLREAVRRLSVPLHLFGHVHDCPGIEVHDGIMFSNASMDLVKRPCVFDIAVRDASLTDSPQTFHAGHPPTGPPGTLLALPSPPHTILLADAHLWRDGTAPALDVDTADAERQTVTMGRQRRSRPPSQRWIFIRQAQQAAEIVAIASAYNMAEGHSAAPGRFLSYDLAAGHVFLGDHPMMWIITDATGAGVPRVGNGRRAAQLSTASGESNPMAMAGHEGDNTVRLVAADDAASTLTSAWIIQR